MLWTVGENSKDKSIHGDGTYDDNAPTFTDDVYLELEVQAEQPFFGATTGDLKDFKRAQATRCIF